MQIANATNGAQPEAGMPFKAQAYATSSSSSPGASTGASTSSGSSTAAVTANDFLQLLVTELQNQDPTANTDPNEYVNQLVQVNSLQQQIQMNQTLDSGPSLTGAGTGVLQKLEQIEGTLNGDLASAEASPNVRSAQPALAYAAAAQPAAAGNLSVPSDARTQASAEAVASALAPHPGHQNQATSGTRNPTIPRGVFQQFAARLRSGTSQQ